MIRRLPRAIEAIIEQAEYIGRDSVEVSNRFMQAVQTTFDDLEAMPGMGHRYESTSPKLAGILVWAIKGFPNHLIFYRSTSDGIEIITLLHGARDILRILPDEI